MQAVSTAPNMRSPSGHPESMADCFASPASANELRRGHPTNETAVQTQVIQSELAAKSAFWGFLLAVRARPAKGVAPPRGEDPPRSGATADCRREVSHRVGDRWPGPIRQIPASAR